MADTPLRTLGVPKQSGGCEEEQSPAAPPQPGLRTVNRAQNLPYLGFVAVVVGQPIACGAGVMLAAPAPIQLQPEIVPNMADEIMAWHDAAGEEMLRDPILLVINIEQIRRGAVAEPTRGGAKSFRYWLTYEMIF